MSSVDPPHQDDAPCWTEPTTGYWQRFEEGWPAGEEPAPPFRFGYPARLPDGRVLVLPLRRLPDGAGAVASLIANQASLAVVSGLADHMARLASRAGAEVVLGLPTLGLAFAPLVAGALGHSRYVPLGYSRKFWYDEVLSEPVSSITSPGGAKRIYLDPNQFALLHDRRIAIVDDAISSGRTVAATVRLLRKLSLEPAAIVVAMTQTKAWRDALAALGADLPARVHGVLSCPRFRLGPDGWLPV